MEWMLDPQAWVALATLTALEIVLGIDNIIFISVLVSRLPLRQRNRARTLGIGLAMITRIALLLCLAWIMGMTRLLFTFLANEISGREKAPMRYITAWRGRGKHNMAGSPPQALSVF